MSFSGFDGVVFAGGGCRCFWQAGFFAEAQARLQIAPKEVAAASAGAALACVSLTGTAARALRNFKRRAHGNQRNVYPERLLGSRSVFPHAELFRAAVLETIDAESLSTIQCGPQFHVALTRPPRRVFGVPLSAGASVLAGVCAYQLERRSRGRVHGEWPKRLGFEVEWARADNCEDIEALADLLLHTSCTPPFTPAFARDGRPVIDGGLTDNVPVEALRSCERILVLLTRRFENLPSSERVLYVQPSQPVTIGVWDYTSPEAIQSAFDLGRRDGEAFAARSQP